MYDLPQQPPDGQVIIPIEVGERDAKITQDEVIFDILECPTPPQTKLEGKDLYAFAHFLKAKYPNGFTWTEIPRIMDEVVAYISPNPEMSIKEKRLAAIDILHYLLVSIDALYLPEKATESFFEELLPPFLMIAFTFPSDRALIQPSRSESLTKEQLTDYAEQLIKHFEDGMTWKNLSLATRHALTYILSYEKLTEADRKEGTFAIVETILIKTDPSRLPPHFDEKLFTPFLKSFIELQLHSRQNSSQ